MKSTVEPLEGNKVKVSVEVDEVEFDRAIDAAFRKIASEVRIKGFRPGKAPRRVLETYVGAEYAREQALRDAIPSYLDEALREHEVDWIAQAEDVEVTSGQESGPVQFDATIEVRPTVSVAGYGGLRIELPNPKPTPAEVDEQLERLRLPTADLVDVERPAARGDFVTIDLVGATDGDPLPGLDVQDYLYEVGSGQVVEELDFELIGSSAGDHLEFTAPHPVPERDPIDFEVTVKTVQERVLPELTDQWVGENTDLDTVEALRTDLARRMHVVRAAQADDAIRERVAEALVDLVDDDAPEALVAGELRARIDDLVQRVQSQGLSVEQWMAMTGQDAETVTAGLRDAAEKAVKVDLALRAVADAEEIEVSDDDLEREYAQLAQRHRMKASEVRKAYEKNRAVAGLRTEIRKRKALAWLSERVEIVDPEGAPVPRADLIPPTDAADEVAVDDIEERS